MTGLKEREFAVATTSTHEPVKWPDDTRVVNPGVVDRLAGKLKIRVPKTVLEWLLAPAEMEAIVAAARDFPEGSFFDGALQALGIALDCTDADRRRIPGRGPALLVANHPFGLLEGLLLGALVSRIREDYRFIANSLLASVPEIGRRVIPADPFGARESVQQNSVSVRQAQHWLEQGGVLITFPAGEVSNLHGIPPSVTDSEWSSRIIRLARRQGVPVVPVFTAGRNSIPFQLAGLVYPALRTALLCRELLNKRGRSVTVAVGTPIRAEQMTHFGTDRDLTEYLRERTYALAHRPAAMRAPGRQRATIAHETPAGALANNVAALPPEALVFAKGDYQAYVASAAELPRILPEIGRLREISFRAAGEGTGHARDLDRFDQHYRHLFLWKSTTREIVGGYRLAEVDRVLDEYGAEGLYTHTLFRFEPEFLERLRSGLELGRSFIRPEYQRSIHSLHYLWKAIGAYTQRSPRRYLFGPVSISDQYSEASRELIVEWFEQRMRARAVHPRRAFESRNLRHLASLARQAPDLDSLCELIADLERDGKEIPVLLRHYLNLGGEVLGFNVDREFSNVLDGLLLVDLEQGNAPALARYLGTKAQRAGTVVPALV